MKLAADISTQVSRHILSVQPKSHRKVKRHAGSEVLIPSSSAGNAEHARKATFLLSLKRLLPKGRLSNAQESTIGTSRADIQKMKKAIDLETTMVK